MDGLETLALRRSPDGAAGGGAATAAPISVIIPSKGRVAGLPYAVQSALAQSLTPLEVLVVVDGPHADAINALENIHNERLRIVSLDKSVGEPNARMVGVAEAKGEWIAFLDDDDSWQPGKLELQYRCAQSLDAEQPIVGCRCLVETALGKYVWPRRLIEPSETIADYLFIRHTLFKGEAIAPTSSLLFRRSLIEQVPFRPGVHDYWDWLVRCGSLPSCRLVMIDEVVCNHLADEEIDLRDELPDLDDRLAWAYGIRQRLSPQAYAGLVMQVIGGADEARDSWRRRGQLLWQGLRHGRPTIFTCLLFFLHTLMPIRVRRRFRPPADQPT